MDLNIDEKRAVHAASESVGAYLERIGKTDLTTLTQDEWLGFIAHAYSCVAGEVRELWKKECPF